MNFLSGLWGAFTLDLFLNSSPILIIGMCSFLIYSLSRLKQTWEVKSLYTPLLAYIALYSWIGFQHPTADASRVWVRLTLLFSLGVLTYIAASHLLRYGKGRK